MPTLTLAEGMRFLFPGVVGYIYLYFLFPTQMREFAEASGTIGFPLILGVVGSLVYFVYRPVIYDPLIERLQRSWNPFGVGYRELLTKIYDISFDESTRFFILIRDAHLESKYKNLGMQAAGIHMLYLAGILGVLIGIVGCALVDERKPMVIIVIGIVGLIGGFLYDTKYEALEADLIKNLEPSKVEEIATRQGYVKKKG